MENERLDSVSKILILGWGLIGDVFIRVPLIEALRRRFPNAHIAVVVDPVAAPVLKGNSACDEVIIFDRDKKKRWRYLVNTAKQLTNLRRRGFDLCINLYLGGSSNRFSKIINANMRVCFDHTQEQRWANNILVHTPSFSGNWSKALGTMLEPLGVPGEEIRQGTSFFCSAAAIEYARSFVGNKLKPLVAFNMGAGSIEKCWPVERFVALAHEINRCYGFTPLVFTNPGMEELANEFAKQYGSDAIVAPLLPLDSVGALMLECDYVITGDTSLMHMAFGLKRPTLVLFTYTRPEMVMPEDCIVEACFVESKSGQKYCGKPAGCVDIPVEEAVYRFGLLQRATQSQLVLTHV